MNFTMVVSGERLRKGEVMVFLALAKAFRQTDPCKISRKHVEIYRIASCVVTQDVSRIPALLAPPSQYQFTNKGIAASGKSGSLSRYGPTHVNRAP